MYLRAIYATQILRLVTDLVLASILRKPNPVDLSENTHQPQNNKFSKYPRHLLHSDRCSNARLSL